MNAYRRHLAAILFTDIPRAVPEAVLTAPDPPKVLRQYHDILTVYHKVFGGRIINHYGHSSVSLFTCTLDALRCARAMQREFLSMGRRNVRMGLHIGEVLDEVEDVTGASVNLAARIQDLGVPGSVLFSDIVYAQIRNQPEFKAKPLGKFPLKNISDKVTTYALKETGIVVPSRTDILMSQQFSPLKMILLAPWQALLFLLRMITNSLS